MEYVLVIDTSSMTGLCALAQKQGADWKILTEQYVDAESSHSEILFMSIQNVLDENKIKFSDLKMVVYCAGPGSFTGLRISYSAVKAFTLAQGIKAVGVSTLRALMYNLKDAKEKYKAVIIAGGARDAFALIEDKEHNVVLTEASYDINTVLDFLNGMSGAPVACIATRSSFNSEVLQDIKGINMIEGRVTVLGMLSLLEDHAIDGINYLKASYAEKK